MRGKAQRAFHSIVTIGITPAYAGKSSSCGQEGCCAWDHPRLCGEKSFKQFRTFCVKGSPPPMRGKVLHFVQSSQRNRITPAYAGKSSGNGNTDSRRQDHPRLCGEKLNTSRRRLCGTGSPPPMRGKAPHNRVFLQQSGITPAYAGKSITVAVLHFVQRDHPRLCGEK